MSKNNVISRLLIEGSVNTDIYIDFLKYNQVLFENKIIVQDNARIHHSVLVKDYAQEVNIILKYNPAYSPEFNPIELLFNKVKCEYRKLSHLNIYEAIDESINTITSDNCFKFYEHTKKCMSIYN